MKLLKASKILHIVVLLCCFLPAIIPSCEDSPSKQEIEQREKDKQDSLDKVAATDTLKINSGDSALADTTAAVTNTDTIKTNPTIVESAKDTGAVKNTKSEKNALQKALNFIAFPDGDNLSIVGYMFFWLESSCPVIFLLLLIWAILLRFTNSNHKLIFIQTLLGFIALSLFMPDKVKDLMWGFWAAYFLSLFNVILNWRIYFDAKRNKQTNVWGDL